MSASRQELKTQTGKDDGRRPNPTSICRVRNAVRPRGALNRLGRLRHGKLYPRGANSTAHVFVEPVDCALPGQIGRGFVIPLRRRVAIEAMYGTRVNIALVRNVRRVQGLVVSRP